MIVLDGKKLPETSRVKENIVFKPGMPNTRKWTKSNPQGFALHWTGGENKSPTVIRTLTGRNLSIHFIGEPTGELVQTADLASRCAHISSPGNDRFVGIEMVSRGYPTKADFEKAKAEDPSLRLRSELDWSIARDTYQDKIGGKSINMVSFAPQMLENVLWLSETLAGHLELPREIPCHKVTITDKLLESLPVPNPEDFIIKHAGATWLPYFGRDVDPAKFRGTLGHFHVHKTKADPGTQPFYLLWAEGWNPAGKKLPKAITGMF